MRTLALLMSLGRAGFGVMLLVRPRRFPAAGWARRRRRSRRRTCWCGWWGRATWRSAWAGALAIAQGQRSRGWVEAGDGGAGAAIAADGRVDDAGDDDPGRGDGDSGGTRLRPHPRSPAGRRRRRKSAALTRSHPPHPRYTHIMCGRFTLTRTDFDKLAEDLAAEPRPAERALYRPRYNIAPTDQHWIVRTKLEERQLIAAKWGLVNSWAPDAKGAARQINARSETAMHHSRVPRRLRVAALRRAGRRLLRVGGAEGGAPPDSVPPATRHPARLRWPVRVVAQSRRRRMVANLHDPRLPRRTRRSRPSTTECPSSSIANTSTNGCSSRPMRSSGPPTPAISFACSFPLRAVP